MKHGKSPGTTGRHRSGPGKVVGVASGKRRTATPPPVPDGKVRCEVCRNVTVLTASGHLRRHRDLFGNDCYNKSARRAS